MALLVGVLLVGVLPGRSGAQDAEQAVLEELQAAFEEGNVDRLLTHAAGRLDVSILGASDIYSRSQARYVLADFFRQYPPGRFSFEPATRRGGNCFAGGAYTSRQEGAPLGIYVRLRRVPRGWELREVRIERRAQQ